MKRVLKKVFGILALLLGTLIFLYPDYRGWKMAEEADKVREMAGTPIEDEGRPGQTDQNGEIMAESKGTSAENNPETGTGTSEPGTEDAAMDLYQAFQDYNRKLAENRQEITDAWIFRQSPVDLNALNNGSEVAAYIEIGEIDLKLPLYIGATEENMSKGAVVLTGTSMPIGGKNTNCVIAGHRGYSGSPYFRDIDQLHIGSEVHIVNLWEDMTYRVSGTRIIHATECDILKIQPGKDMITLFSCYPYMSTGTRYRLVVFCERAEESEKEPIQAEADIRVRDLIEEELDRQGIIIGDAAKEELSHKEDLIRIILPCICAIFALMLIILRRGPGRKKYSGQKKRSKENKDHE